MNDTINFPKDYQLGNNVLFNETDVREFHFIVNGKQPVEGEITDKRSMKFVAHRCISDCDPDKPPPVECDPPNRKWSEPKDWDPEEDPSKRVDFPIPQAGDSFKIPSNFMMELDIGETPVFNEIEINGCLNFKNGKDGEDIHL